MNENYKDLLTIKPQEIPSKKNVLDIWVEWVCNDDDLIEHSFSTLPENLFNNKKLIYCLAYVTCESNFKDHDWDDNVFNSRIVYNNDIIDLEKIIKENGYMPCNDYDFCHSLSGLGIVYYDENGTPFDISFEDIQNRWAYMTYQEICDEINNIIKDKNN